MEEAVYDIIKVYLAQVHSATKISKIICETACDFAIGYFKLFEELAS